MPDDPQEFVEDDLAWSPVRAGALPERPEPLMVLLMSPKPVPISVETVTPEIRMAWAGAESKPRLMSVPPPDRAL